jgi:precorrin-6B methylase 2
MLYLSVLAFMVVLLVVYYYPPAQDLRQRLRVLRTHQNTWQLLKFSYVIDCVFDQQRTYLAAKQDRKNLPADLAHTYGEIPFLTLVQVLQTAQAKAGDVFYDLGSGDGRALCIALLAVPFAKVCGIERLPTLHNLSQAYVAKLAARQDIPKHFSASYINCQHGDYYQLDFSEADIVFINATAIFGECWTQLIDKLQGLKKHSRVITTSRQIEAENFQLIDAQWRPLSWGPNRVYIYRKLS